MGDTQLARFDIEQLPRIDATDGDAFVNGEVWTLTPVGGAIVVRYSANPPAIPDLLHESLVRRSMREWEECRKVPYCGKPALPEPVEVG